MNNYNQELGYYSATRRLIHRFKSADLAVKIGYSKQSFYNFESGKNMLPLIYLPKLCNILQINIDDFLFMKEELEDFVINDEIINKQVSNNIRFVRKSRCMTQEEVAQHLSCNKKTVHKYEAGFLPTITFIYNFCHFFNIKPSYILYGDIYEDRLKQYLHL